MSIPWCSRANVWLLCLKTGSGARVEVSEAYIHVVIHCEGKKSVTPPPKKGPAGRDFSSGRVLRVECVCERGCVTLGREDSKVTGDRRDRGITADRAT